MGAVAANVAALAAGGPRSRPRGARQDGTASLSFREELHAIEAVIAGQGVAILSDVLVGRELASGALVKVLDPPLPGFGFYLAHVPDHPRQAVIEVIRRLDSLRCLSWQVLAGLAHFLRSARRPAESPWIAARDPLRHVEPASAMWLGLEPIASGCHRRSWESHY